LTQVAPDHSNDNQLINSCKSDGNADPNRAAVLIGMNPASSQINSSVCIDAMYLRNTKENDFSVNREIGLVPANISVVP